MFYGPHLEHGDTAPGHLLPVIDTPVRVSDGWCGLHISAYAAEQIQSVRTGGDSDIWQAAPLRKIKVETLNRNRILEVSMTVGAQDGYGRSMSCLRGSCYVPASTLKTPTVGGLAPDFPTII